MYDVIGRIFDNSEFMEYVKELRPRNDHWSCKDGRFTGVVANAQGSLMNYLNTLARAQLAWWQAL